MKQPIIVLSVLAFAAASCAERTITTRIDPATGKPVEISSDSSSKKTSFPRGSLFTLYQEADVSVAELNSDSMALVPVSALSFNPVWAPDGNHYAVIRARPVTNVQQLVIYEKSSPADPVPIAQFTNETATGYPFSMAFSPDSRKLAYTSVNAELAAIFVSDLKNRNTVMLVQDAERRTRRIQWQGDWIIITLTDARVLAIRSDGLSFDTAPSLEEIGKRSFVFNGLIEPKLHAGNLYGLEPAREGTKADYRLVMYDLDGKSTPKNPEKSVMSERVGPVFDIAPDGTLALLMTTAQTRVPLELAIGPRPNLMYQTGIRPYQIRFTPDSQRLFLVTVSGAKIRYVMYSVASRTAIEFAALKEAENAEQLSALVRQPLMSIR